MTRRVCILHTPSPYNDAWRWAINSKAHQAGWSVGEFGAHRAANDDVDCIINCLEAHHVAQTNATDVVIFLPPGAPSSPCIDAGDQLDVAARHARMVIQQLSLKYAHAAPLAAEGATLVSPGAEGADIPGLGWIERGLIDVRGQEELGREHGLYDYFNLRAGFELVWPWSAFEIGEGHIQGENWSTDLTGRARMLVYGPYRALPPGRWRVETEISISGAGALPDIRFEWGSPTEGDMIEPHMDRSGMYRIAIEREWREVAPAEFRIILARPVFHASLTVSKCRVIYLG